MSSDLSALLHARYGRQAANALPSATPPLNDVLATLLSHRSVRAFLPDALASGTLELLVAAAQSAATSSNLQAWSVVAVEDKARKARLAVLARDQKHIAEAPLFLVWLADLSRLRRIASTAGSTSDGLDYLESFLLAVIDAALAAQNAAAAAFQSSQKLPPAGWTPQATQRTANASALGSRARLSAAIAALGFKIP